MNIRNITINDSENFLSLCKRIDAETKNMGFSTGERNLTIKQQEESIKNILENKLSNIWVAEHNNILIGYLIAVGNTVIRKKHSLYIAIGVIQDFNNMGVGTALLTSLIKWAEENSIHRIELTVRVTNSSAIHLYKKIGFKEEGIKKHSLLIDSKYEDELYMSKLLE